jgi:(p)ppGpp synthase/HD superfamily hydrolase
MTDIEVELFDKAMRIARGAHIGQVDKAGSPYIQHPIRVAERCNTPYEKIVALLHDTIEDSNISAAYLLYVGFPEVIVDAVLSVTRKEGESYEDFIIRAKQNSIGKIVKLADLEDNLDIRRLPELGDNDLIRLNKYLRAYRYLKA